MERYFIVFYRGAKPGKTETIGFSHVTTKAIYLQMNTYLNQLRKLEGFTEATIAGVIELSKQELEESKK